MQGNSDGALQRDDNFDRAGTVYVVCASVHTPGRGCGVTVA
jgi:hypothetical protein